MKVVKRCGPESIKDNYIPFFIVGTLNYGRTFEENICFAQRVEQRRFVTAHGIEQCTL